MSALNGAALLITGGAGSFGHTAFKYFPENGVQQIRFFSRDEKQQDDMRHALSARRPDDLRRQLNRTEEKQ